MIGRLRGRVELLGEEHLIMDVNGVGYLVYCSSQTLTKLIQNEEAVLEIETHVREDNIQLFGFDNFREKDCFKMLSSVQGVGSKVALAILGYLAPENLTQVISAQDKKTLTESPGVGPKLASRIIVELREKIGATMSLPQQTSTFTDNKNDKNIQFLMSQEAVSGLVNLGYNRTEAMVALSQVMETEKKELSVEDLIRKSLRKLSNLKSF